MADGQKFIVHVVFLWAVTNAQHPPSTASPALWDCQGASLAAWPDDRRDLCVFFGACAQSTGDRRYCCAMLKHSFSTHPCHVGCGPLGLRAFDREVLAKRGR